MIVPWLTRVPVVEAFEISPSPLIDTPAAIVNTPPGPLLLMKFPPETAATPESV